MRVLITGACGFIGASLAGRLLARGDSVLGIDNLNSYYEVSLKEARLERLLSCDRFTFRKVDVADRQVMNDVFSDRFDTVMHLAAQAGVRYSSENPYSYADANLSGFLNVLEGIRRSKSGHFVFASSSSVYGANTRLPFSEHDNIDHPVSLYAATKKANELMAHCYAHLHAIPCTGLRFFTVYGPWGRPDMSYFKFTKCILEGKPIPVFNNGDMVRDFTYIDDIVEGVVRVMDRPAVPNVKWNAADPDPASSSAPYRIYNIGNNKPVALLRYIEVLEKCLGKKAQVQMLPMQPGDVRATLADITSLASEFGYQPSTTVEEGLPKFVAWYRDYYKN